MNTPSKCVNCIESYSSRLNITNRQFENEPENVTSKTKLIGISAKGSCTSYTPLINKTKFVNHKNNNEYNKDRHKIFSSLLKKIRNGKEKASVNIKNYYDKKKYTYIYEKNLGRNKKKFTLLNCENDDSININNDTNIGINDGTKINQNANFLKFFQHIKNESTDGEVAKLRGVKIDGSKQNKKIEDYLINLQTNQNRNPDMICNPHMKYLRNIKKLLHISDEEIKDVIEISKFEINLNINTFYCKFINENSDNSLLKYNVNYNKNVYDIQEKRGHKNEKIISYKKKFPIGFLLHQYNISMQENLYYCYRIYEPDNFENDKNNMRSNIDHRKCHHFCAETNVYEENYDKYCSAMKYKESISNSDELLTSQYIDDNFDEIYYIQRINANNDTFSVFVKIYQIYIFSRVNNDINIDNKEDKNNDNNNNRNAQNRIKGYRNLEDSYEERTNSCNSNKTKVSIYVFITILNDSLLKYIIKKKILYDVTNCINQWEIDIITEVQNLKNTTSNISMSIKIKEWNDNIYCIIKNIENFINDYLIVFIRNIAINIIYFLGVYENNMLQNYISFLKTEDSNNLHTRQKYTFKSIYNDIKKKIQELKPKKKRSNEHRQKKRQNIPHNQNYKKGHNWFQNIFKKNDDKKKHTFFYDDACFFNNLTIDKKKCYFKSHHEANSYVAYINSIYYRRVMFLYILFFFVYIAITKSMSCSCYA
ncbi:conserved Plasmodium protein, unknown function [Plasmodium chabaudi adami]|uniref:Uncharacterized protein n=1 Tax=Plasmodium chabaudi adami TaxID=5826 RepID=A0A1D3S0I2_PLACE|nr:conserved Plasmodium protein, unknown function [Plasmodium chabaudi adami]